MHIADRIFPVRSFFILDTPPLLLYIYLFPNPSNLTTSPIRNGSEEGIADMILPRRSRYLIKRWNMFQTSSEGGNPGLQVRQNTRGKRIRFYFLLSCELDIGRSRLPFHFFKAALSRSLIRSFGAV